MSGSGGNRYDMWDSASEEFEVALTSPSGERGAGAVGNWVDNMRTLRMPPTPDVAANHVTVAAATAREAAATDMSPAAVPVGRWTLFRRRLARSSLVTGIVAKVLGVSVAMATVTGGIAATGVLPDPVQDPIAGVYNAVGFDFPTSADDDEADEPGDDDTPAVVGDPSDDQGDDDQGDDDQGDDPGDDQGDDDPDDDQGDDDPDDDQGDDDQGDDDPGDDDPDDDQGDDDPDGDDNPGTGNNGNDGTNGNANNGNAGAGNNSGGGQGGDDDPADPGDDEGNDPGDDDPGSDDDPGEDS